MRSRQVTVEAITGLTPYGPMLERQKARRQEVEEGAARDTLFLLEHEPTITLGREADEANIRVEKPFLEQQGIALVPADRGGDVTYHGPGQLVAYPVLNLAHWRKSVNWYLRALEETLIRTLAAYGLEGERSEGLTGVWVEGAKVAAIGIGVRKWVTFHGIALNVAPDMAHFGYIVPCGIADKPVTSLEKLLGKAPSMQDVQQRFVQAFLKEFDAEGLVAPVQG